MRCSEEKLNYGLHLAFTSAGGVPFFAELTTASDIWYGEYRTVPLKESEHSCTEKRIDRDSEASITLRGKSSSDIDRRIPN